MNTRQIGQVRAFNRFYTNVIGLLNHYLLRGHYSLPEVRVMYEITHQRNCTAKSITETFDIDKGYLSRVLLKLQKARLITTRPSPEDGRSLILQMTAQGAKEFHELECLANDQIKGLVKGLRKEEKDELVYHMQAIERILSKK
ncbi:MarR family winged helix-turn-helix transcriptional regulator [Chitinophaga vietnamensis]|uniref:MarR family winged helix-turn-helix transcriptional regulator n=1 Tax=Chitinophaga vietnamensis TaxID=2593957 RepID=UPI00117761F5|nr:MarR family winged helix-turn-helix transcriptional regulator [Chitinophaga vietnamensis]